MCELKCGKGFLVIVIVDLRMEVLVWGVGDMLGIDDFVYVLLDIVNLI